MGATVCGQPAARKGACFLRAGVEKQSIQPMANAKEFFVLWRRGVQAFLKRTQGKELCAVFPRRMPQRFHFIFGSF